MIHSGFRRAFPLPTLLALTLAAGLAQAASTASPKAPNIRPAWLGPIQISSYDGITDDLLTGGQGKSGLGTAKAAATFFVDPFAPKADELRRLVIYTNYRALVDTTSAGGYGRIFGPNIDLAGNDTLGEGKVPGREYLAFAKNVAGVKNVTLLVQVPKSFDTNNPCIIAAPSSGSRGVYGAIGTTGEWALKHGCAVAYTDKGTGAGAHDLETDRVTLINGTLNSASAAGKNAYFAANLSATERAAYVGANHYRYAMKHAHSGDNPERVWGRATVNAVEFAFYVLNECHTPSGPTAACAPPSSNKKATKGKGNKKASKYFGSGNTLVIAASVSNGGGAVLAAAEDDHRRLIDGIVAVEPQVNLKLESGAVSVSRGGVPVAAFGLPLYDYITFANLYQPCAAIAPSIKTLSPFNIVDPTKAANRCSALTAAGMLTGATQDEQAENALLKLREHGWEEDSDLLHASHYGFAVAPAVSLTYANAYSRAKVTDNLCHFSMAFTDPAGLPAAPTAATDPMPTIWSLSNGVPPSTSINLVAQSAANGPIREQNAISASTGLADYNFDGAACLRGLFSDEEVLEGIAEVKVKGDLRGRPTLIVHGRADNLVPVNHTSRPYLGANNVREGAASQLSYIEVTNGQHFEAFLPLPGYNSLFIPLHYYAGQAMEKMWAHLTAGTPLPKSQVVRTTPRGAGAPNLELINLPSIAQEPLPEDTITVSNGAVNVPE
ncbi:MAG: D-(-)-3-hydroxybutyrate oligomer hydrolase [Zoogloeaceae bacterium]|nr:D-(-)-3-hydroxybutyrate oligomer hydrolase [Zoogloeaceae bacterium]